MSPETLLLLVSAGALLALLAPSGPAPEEGVLIRLVPAEPAGPGCAPVLLLGLLLAVGVALGL